MQLGASDGPPSSCLVGRLEVEPRPEPGGADDSIRVANRCWQSVGLGDIALDQGHLPLEEGRSNCRCCCFLQQPVGAHRKPLARPDVLTPRSNARPRLWAFLMSLTPARTSKPCLRSSRTIRRPVSPVAPATKTLEISPDGEANASSGTTSDRTGRVSVESRSPRRP